MHHACAHERKVPLETAKPRSEVLGGREEVVEHVEVTPGQPLGGLDADRLAARATDHLLPEPEPCCMRKASVDIPHRVPAVPRFGERARVEAKGLRCAEAGAYGFRIDRAGHAGKVSERAAKAPGGRHEHPDLRPSTSFEDPNGADIPGSYGTRPA